VHTTDQLDRQPFATGPILVISTAITVGLLLLSQWHGFHRDELYFIVAGRNLAFGYPDQPPLTPLLSAMTTALLGAEPFAVRLLPALSVGASIILVAAMARDMSGSSRAQILAALTIGLSGLLAAGHLGSTATYEMFLWAVVMWLVVRLLAGSDARLWLAVGLASGLALQNKQTALILGVGLVAGLLVARRWDVFRSPMLWLGGLIAALIWAPNVAWQALNGFPQLEMAGAIATEAGENRIMLVPELMLLAGPMLFPIALAGLWWLIRRPEARPWRALPAAFAVIVFLVLLSGGKSYYAAGMFGPLMAAGAIVVDGWLGRGRERLKGATVAVAAALSGLLVAVLTLPVLPPPILAQTAISELYPESAEQVGWPELVDTVTAAADSLTAEEREHTVILAVNYGEAGAIEVLGEDLPPTYSGHNGFADWGPPPDEATSTILVGHWGRPPSWLGRCQRTGTVDNGVDLDNEEQGAGVWVCRGRVRSWRSLWPSLTQLG
jgi:4-amino-4-deoxy-L-arabinose transferase-like glycosyltransferase